MRLEPMYKNQPLLNQSGQKGKKFSVGKFASKNTFKTMDKKNDFVNDPESENHPV